MNTYDTLIAWLLANKSFDEIKKDGFLFSLYQIWDMGFWDDEYDIPLTYKRKVARINSFLKIDINKINKSWASRSIILQDRFVEYFNTILKKKYLKRDTLYVVSNRIDEDESHGAKSKVYEIPITFRTNENKQAFIECVKELIHLNHFKVVGRDENDVAPDDVKSLFKAITPEFLHIICQDNISASGTGKVFVIGLTDEEVRVLTGIQTKYGEGWYLKAQFSPSENNINVKEGVEENNGIVSIDTIDIAVKFISAKNSDRKIYADHYLIIDPNKSGLPFDVKIIFADSIRNTTKNRIFIEQNGRFIPYLFDLQNSQYLSRINMPKRVSESLKRWISRNRNVLLQYIHGEVTDATVLDSIVPVKTVNKTNDK